MTTPLLPMRAGVHVIKLPGIWDGWGYALAFLGVMLAAEAAVVGLGTLLIWAVAR